MLKGAPSLVFAQCPLVRWLCVWALTLTCSRITLAYPLRDSNPLFDFSDQVRLRHLYTDNEHRHLHLQISPEGEVSGTEDQNLYSLLEIKAVKPRILVMRGKTSTRYLCMDSSRHLYGSETYKENDCNFREVLLEDGYNVYYSEKHNSPLTLTPTRLGKPTGKEMSRFLPRDSRGESRIPMEFTADPCDLQGRNLNVESDDPLGVKDQSNILTPCLDS